MSYQPVLLLIEPPVTDRTPPPLMLETLLMLEPPLLLEPPLMLETSVNVRTPVNVRNLRYC